MKHSVPSLSPLENRDAGMRVHNTFLEFGDAPAETDARMRIARAQTWNIIQRDKSDAFLENAASVASAMHEVHSIRRIQSMASYASTASFPMAMYMADHYPCSLPADAYPKDYEAPPGLIAPTTMMLRNFPRRSTQKRLLAALDASGFDGQYDFVYMPFCFDKKMNLGYAFINFRSSRTSYDFYIAWHKQSLSVDSWGDAKTRPMNVSVAQIQGRLANMHRVIKECKVGKITNPQFQPVVYDEFGNRLDFATMSENQRAKRCQKSRQTRAKDRELVSPAQDSRETASSVRGLCDFSEWAHMEPMTLKAGAILGSQLKSPRRLHGAPDPDHALDQMD